MRLTKLARLALLAFAVSCSDALSPDGRQIRDFENAHRRWQARDLHTYAFTLQRSCFCVNVNPLYVVVLNDRVGGVFDLNAGHYVDVQLGETIDDLFTFIQSAIAHHASVIRAEYDPVSGFPTQVDYDGSSMAADDELSLRVSDVHPITPQSVP